MHPSHAGVLTPAPMHALQFGPIVHEPHEPAIPGQLQPEIDAPKFAAETRITRRVTQGDIARQAGVHNTTVSLVLRNHPSIPAATRRRILDLAESMGYRPDPALRALVAYRNGIKVSSVRPEPIAYVTNAETRTGWRDNEADMRWFLGAERKAAEWGYQLEHFWLGEPEMTQRRLGEVLFNRGITGVLLASHRAYTAKPIDLGWERLAAVALGYLPQVLALHRVANNPVDAIRLAVGKCFAAGYRRLGLLLPDRWESAGQAWSAGFEAEQNRLPAAQRIPIFFHGLPGCPSRIFNAQQRHSIDTTKLGDWFSKFHPDVVIGSFRHAYGLVTALGLQVPRDVAFVDLLNEGNDPKIAGVRQNCERVGELAVEILVSQLHQNVRGVPAVATTTLVEGAWHGGMSLPNCPSSNYAAS